MSDIKKLQKLYDDYKLICMSGKDEGMSQGGEVTPKPGKKSLEMPEMKPVMSSDEKVIDTLHHIVKKQKGMSDGGMVDQDPGFQAFMQQNPNLDPSIAKTAYEYRKSRPDYKAPPMPAAQTPSPNPYDKFASDVNDPNRQGYTDGGEVEDNTPYEMIQKYKDLGMLPQDEETIHSPERADIIGQIPQNPPTPMVNQDVQPASQANMYGPGDETGLDTQYLGEDVAAQEDTDGGLDTSEMEINDQPGKIAENAIQKQESQPIPKQDSPTSEAKSSQNPEGKTNDLANAQSQRDSNIAGQQIMKGAALFSAGKLKTNPDTSLKVIGDNDKYVGIPVQKYDEQIANQKNDPNSPMTKAVEDYLTSKGIKPIKGASAHDYLTYMPFLQKDQALKAAMEKAQMNIKSREGVSEANRLAADERSRKNNETSLQSANIRANAIKGGQEKSQTRQSQRLAGQLVQKVNADSIIKPSLQNLASLHKSKALLENKGLPLTPQVLADAEQDISSALTLRGMGATEGKIKRTELITLGRMFTEAKQKWGNQPDVDLRKEEPALVAQIYKTNKALIDDYNTTIAERKHDLASEYEAGYGDDEKLMKVINQYKKKKPEINADDQKALEHYKSLPDTYPNKEKLGNILKGKGLL